MKPPFPPTGVTVAEPSLSPLQVASFTLDTEQLNGAGCPMVTSQEVVHPFESVTATECMPAFNAVAVAVVSPLSQR